MGSRQRTAIFAAVAAACLTMRPPTAGAGTATSNMTVTATISNNCTISTPTLAFGAYDPVTTNASSDLNASTAFSLKCTTGASTTIDLGQGLNAAGGSTSTVPLRQMAAGGNKMAYYLYTDGAHTTVWGAGAATRAYTGTGATDTSVVCYGRVPSAQNLPAGSYSDTVVATINF